MAVSLYDQYHSEKNITHIYNIIDTLVKKKTGKSIKEDTTYVNIYNSKLKNIFIESKNDTLEKLNRELILHHVQFFVNKIQTQQTPTPSIPPKRSLNAPMRTTELPSLPKNNDEIPEMSFEDLINQRNKDIPNILSKSNTSNSKQTDISKLPDNTADINFTDLIQKDSNKIIKPIIKDISQDESMITISSINRLDTRSNRFNYKVELKESVKRLNRVILPIETNIYFSLPILKLTIPEFKYETDVVCEKTYIFNHRKMGIYIPLNKDVDYIQTETITIVLSNHFNHSIIEPDIVDVEVVDNKISLKRTDLYQIGDIVNIEDRFIPIGATFNIEYETDSKVIEIKNTNLQNILIFN